MLYEDDFEFEEQPADIRDRTIGGKPGGGGRGGGTRRRREPRRNAPGDRIRTEEVPEDAKPAHDLLREILERMGVGPSTFATSLDPRASISRSTVRISAC